MGHEMSAGAQKFNGQIRDMAPIREMERVPGLRLFRAQHSQYANFARCVAGPIGFDAMCC